MNKSGMLPGEYKGPHCCVTHTHSRNLDVHLYSVNCISQQYTLPDHMICCRLKLS
ncbi:hypothetical protein SAMN03159353_10504 [Cedecea sp. NFIX57]|nr:hypothetical protein SAMN03159353_10504 [Cedecea sp. NFIX57]